MPFDGVQIDERTRVLRAWVHELRHGGHRQICGAYHSASNTRMSRGGHCAIGVLLATIVPDMEAIRRLLVETGRHHIISQMNDDGASFAEIADFIERKWLP